MVDAHVGDDERQGHGPQSPHGPGAVERGGLVDLIGHGLQPGQVDDRVVGHRLPHAHEHDGEPGQVLVGQQRGAQPLPPQGLADRRQVVGEQVAEDVGDDQHRQDVGDEEDPAQQALRLDPGVEQQRQAQGDEVGQERGDDRVLEGEQVRAPDDVVGEEVLVVGQPDEVPVAVALGVGEGVEEAGQQRDRQQHGEDGGRGHGHPDEGGVDPPAPAAPVLPAVRRRRGLGPGVGGRGGHHAFAFLTPSR